MLRFCSAETQPSSETLFEFTVKLALSGSLSRPIRYNPARIAAGQTVAAPFGGEESPGCTEQDAG